MGRREGSAGPGHSFYRLWMHSFPTLTVSSVLASRPPGCGSLPAGSLLEVVTRAGWAIPSPRFCSSSSVLPLAVAPPLPQHPGLGSRPAAVHSHWSASPPRPRPCSPTVQVLTVPPLFRTLSHQSGPVGKQMASANQGNSRRIIYKGDYLANGQGHGGVKGTSGRVQPSRTSAGGTVTNPRAGGKHQGRSPENEKEDSPRGHLTLTLRAMTFNQVPACPRPPDLPGGHFTEPADWVLSARRLWLQVMETRFKQL